MTKKSGTLCATIDLEIGDVVKINDDDSVSIVDIDKEAEPGFIYVSCTPFTPFPGVRNTSLPVYRLGTYELVLFGKKG